MPELRYGKAIGQALHDAMTADPNVVVFGEDIAAAGGSFGVTRGLLDAFGPLRVRDTPISEATLLSAAVGAAMGGLKPVVEIMFMDFITLGMDALVNQAAKARFMFGGQTSVPMVLRTPHGGGLAAGPQHSQCLEGWLAHVPGLKVVCPATVAYAYGLMRAAIDEQRELAERKTYLDAQHADLVAALETMEQAIRRMDRETRSRFKETFDAANAGFMAGFPRLFGGGEARLELLDDDLLETGVGIVARPPGKRNSSIHLLSGGEKALTAIALVFALFELSPAPFCMLDEVDAPLDDHNVGRFCALVREMSARVQFIVITHNKTTMEMAGQLTGVTMSEPGVSRLVAVDVDEAVALASA